LFKNLKITKQLTTRKFKPMSIKQTKIYLFLTLMILFGMNQASWAQSFQVTGTVKDNQGMPIPGVNVVEKSTKKGINTDIEGKFTISTSSKGTLIFSFVGYETEQIFVNGQRVVNLQMKSSSTDLDAVVVVAYGKQKKITQTGAIATITSEQLSRSPSANIANSLAGQITGIFTVQASGRPGADDPRIFIRGIASLSEDRSQPLVIVDGVERPFTSLDPDEIETFSLLKDASATAVYGVRGANGVIIVTTKRGKLGKASITASYSQGLQQATQLLDFADSYTYARAFNQSQRNDGVAENDLRFTPRAVEAFRTNSDPIIFPNTDWLDYILKPLANQSRANVNISGGSDKVKYFASLGVLTQDGLFKTFESTYDYNFAFSRYNFRTNLDIEVTKSTKLGITIGSQIGVRNEPVTKDGMEQLFRLLYWAAPFGSPGLVDGKYVVNDSFYIRDPKNEGLDPFYGRGFNNILENRLNFDLDLTQQLNFVKGLNFGLKLSNNTFYSHTKSRSSSVIRYAPIYLSDVPGRTLQPGEDANSIVFQPSGSNADLGYSESQGQGRNWYLESRLNYNRKFGLHNFSGLLLYNQQKVYFPKEPNGAASPFQEIPSGLVGIAGRATYDYNNKYSADVNIGYNGSENFEKSQRFGLFPAVSAGWVVSKESFMEALPVVSFLKLRYSYGIVGNDRIGGGRFLFLPNSFDPSNTGAGYNFGTDVSTNQPGATENKLGNPDVTWEKATKQNLGLELKLFNDKFGMVLELFKENRTDILVTNRGLLPDLLGITSIAPAINVGVVENKGYEVELNWKEQKNKNFGFLLNLNMSYSKNKIIFQEEAPRNQPYQFRTGQSVGQPFGYKFDRFFTQADLDFVVSNRTNNTLDLVSDFLENLKPGDLIYNDLNKDGLIDIEDETAIGYPDYPMYNFGINLNVNVKNFDFNMSWAGATNTSRLLDETFKTPFAGSTRGLLQTFPDNAWTPETANTATLPRLSFLGNTNNSVASDFWIRDASYIRLKTLETGYNFKGSFFKKMGISTFRLFFNANNLITFSKLKIIDPESRTNSTPQYPLTKLYNFGAKLNFL
jgi:TonB-linked SusC/RagA family outer membrane protein